MSERAGASAEAFWADAEETEALQRYRTLVNAVDDGIYQLDAEGRFVAVNDAIVEATGYGREELVGEHVSSVLDAGDVSTIEREIERRLADSTDRRETFELPVRTAGEGRIPCELRLNLLVEDGEFRGTIGVVREITDQERAEQTSTDRRQAEQTSTDRERQLERESDLPARILDTSPVGIAVLDGDGEVTRLNDRATELLGVSERERETYDPADRPTYDEVGRPVPPDERPFARALETGEPVYDRTLQVEQPDGDRRWLSVSAAPILTDGEVEHVVTTGEDITDIKERERELESELSGVFGRVTDAFYALDKNWRFTYANDRAEELVDYTGEGLVGRDFWEVFEWATDSTLGEEYRTAMENQEPTAFEFYYPDPLEAWYEVHAYPSETGLSVYFRDVTERRERERRLEESERRYRTLVEHFPNGAVALVDENLHYRTVGGSTLGVADAPIHEVEGRPVEDALPPELADQLVPRYDAALDGESSAFEVESNGRTYQFQVVPVRDGDGDVFAALGMSQNITDRKEHERYLQDAKSQLEAATEAGAVGTWEWHIPEDQMVTGSTFARKFGIEPDAAREGVSLDRYVSAIHEDDRERVERQIENVIEACGEYEAEYRVWNADGELRWVVARGHVECDEAGNANRFPGALTDITERKRAEQALQENEQQLRTLLRILPVGVIVAEEDGRLVEANEAAEEIWGGFAEAETVADYERYRGWWPDSGEPVAPEEWPLARAIRGEEVTGSEVIEIEGFEGECRTVLFHSMPVRDDDGDVVRAVVTMIDITEREERQQQLQRQNERLESFASMLAHELRNPVTIGQIYSQQLPSDADSKAVEYVTEAFDRIEDMIDIMLMMTRGREAIGESSPVPIADAARGAWAELDAPERTLRVGIDGEIRTDETYVRHLFQNLFENAVQHGGADVTVEVGELPGGFYVADDGRGIPAEDRDAVFEAGYTTAANNGGTGLGLAFVEELAEVYEWECAVVESESGGARFEFRNVDVFSVE